MDTAACAWQIHILLSELPEILPPIFPSTVGCICQWGTHRYRGPTILKYLCNILPQETTSLKIKIQFICFYILRA